MRPIVIVATLALLLSGCAEDTNPEAGGDDKALACTPDATPLKLEAENTGWDSECLATEAGEAFKVEVVNQDGFSHTFSIYEGKGGKQLFKGAEVAGGQSLTYDVPALEQGQQYFQCDFHPDDMNGTFIAA